MSTISVKPEPDSRPWVLIDRSGMESRSSEETHTQKHQLRRTRPSQLSCYTAKGNLELLVLLPLPPEKAYHRHEPPCSSLYMLEMEARASCRLGRHSPEDRGTSLAPHSGFLMSYLSVVIAVPADPLAEGSSPQS